ncbi:MAG TPA: cyclic nucleotide-binding domain-containing protein [Candidatus Limnocylindria bacterium]|nr:cyclic nucleotide-binding domain-containing protein [Candidatus Limnocylindria bacterium]
MGEADSKAGLLRRVPLFASLRQRDLEALERLTDVIDRPGGDVLMRQGQTGNEAFVIIRGGARVERDGRELAIIGAGDVVGEMALISEGPRVATVTLTEPSQLLVIGHREFHTLMEDSPELRRAVFDELGGRIRNLELDHPH